MASLSNTPTGTDEATVSTGNSAAGGSAWTSVSIGTGATLVYDDLSGTTWYRYATGGTSGMVRTEWASITPAWARVYGRVYFVIPAAVLGDVIFNLVRGRATTSQLFRIGVTTGARIAIRNATNGAAETGDVAIVGDTVYRIEWDITIGATATGVVKLYAGDSTTELETITATGANFGTASATEVGFGIASSTVNHPTYWLRGFEANDTAMPGPEAGGGDIIDAAASLSAAAAMTASAVVVRHGSANLTAATSLTAAVVRSTAGASTLAAASALTATAVAVRFGASNLSATSGITAAPIRSTTGGASLTAATTLTATAAAVRFGAANLSAATTLTGTPVRIIPARASLSATTGLSATAMRTVYASANLSGSTTLTATAAEDDPVPGVLTAGTSRPALTAGATRPHLRAYSSRG